MFFTEVQLCDFIIRWFQLSAFFLQFFPDHLFDALLFRSSRSGFLRLRLRWAPSALPPVYCNQYIYSKQSCKARLSHSYRRTLPCAGRQIKMFPASNLLLQSNLRSSYANRKYQILVFMNHLRKWFLTHFYPPPCLLRTFS